MTWALSYTETWHARDDLAPPQFTICGRGRERTPLFRSTSAYDRPAFPTLGKRVCSQCQAIARNIACEESLLASQPPEARVVIYQVADESIRARHRWNGLHVGDDGAAHLRGGRYGNVEREIYGYTKAEVCKAKSLLENVGCFAAFDLVEGLLQQGLVELKDSCKSSVSALLAHVIDNDDGESIAQTLYRFGEPVLKFAASRSIRVVGLTRGEKYDEASPALRRLRIDVDGWPAPPAGLFVVEERTLYLRSRSPMTVAHEFGHALDCALGEGAYRSGTDSEVRQAFAAATSFVTPYAATGIDEYFAECLRAWFGINDPQSLWPRVTPERLKRLDSAMHTLIERYVAQMHSEIGPSPHALSGRA